MQIEAEFFTALTEIGVPTDRARSVAESLSRSIDTRYEIHHDTLATKTDIHALKADIHALKAEMHALKADIVKQILESQRWTITVMFAGLAMLAALQKLL